MDSNELKKEIELANEIKRLNKELRNFQGFPEDYHEVNESQRMKRTDNGRYK